MAHVREGSDEKVDFDPKFKDIELQDDCPDQDQWIRDLFEEEDLKEEFKGFRDTWRTENFHSRHRHTFQRNPGVMVDVADSVTPLHVFSLVFSDEMWE